MPKPMPIKPESNAIGAIIRNCWTAIALICKPSAVLFNPGATKSIRGSAKIIKAIVTNSSKPPTKVVIVSTKGAASFLSRRAKTLTMAL